MDLVVVLRVAGADFPEAVVPSAEEVAVEAGKKIAYIGLAIAILSGCTIQRQGTVQQDLDAYTGGNRSVAFTPLTEKESAYQMVVLDYTLDLKRTTPIEIALFDQFPVFFSQDIRFRTTSSFHGSVYIPAPVPRFASSVDIYISVIHDGKRVTYLTENIQSFLKTYNGRFEPGWNSSPHFILDGLPPDTELHLSLVQQFSSQENTINVVFPGKAFIRQFSFSLNQKTDWRGIDLVTTLPLLKTEHLRSTLVDDILSEGVQKTANTLKPLAILEFRSWEVTSSDYLIVSKPGLSVNPVTQESGNPVSLKPVEGKADPVADRLVTRLIEPGITFSEFRRNPWINSFVSGLRLTTCNDSIAVVFDGQNTKKRDRIASWMKMAPVDDQLIVTGIHPIFLNLYPDWPVLVTGYSWMITSKVGTISLKVGPSELFRSTAQFSPKEPLTDDSDGFRYYRFDFSKSTDLKIFQSLPKQD